MTKAILFIGLFTAIISTTSFSQPVVASSSMPFGNLQLSYTLGHSNESMSLPGGRQMTWDLSNLKPEKASDIIYTSQVRPENPDVFSHSNLAFSPADMPDNLTFLMSNENRLEYLGFVTNVNGVPYLATYSDSWIMYSLPLMFNGAFEDAYACESRLMHGGDTIDYFFRGNYSYAVDGFGTLITPFRTIRNCLRVNATIVGSDSAVYRNKSDSSNVAKYVSNKISWLSADFGNFGEVVSTFNFKDFFFADVKEKKDGVSRKDVKSLTLYPDPATSYVTIDLSGMDKSPIEITLLNNSGSPLKVFHLNLDEAGGKMYTIPVSELLPGIYYLSVRTKHSSYEAEFIKQ